MSHELPTGMFFRDPNTAFEQAIKSGFLSDEPTFPRYAGNFMYMHSAGGMDFFKHKETRRYELTPIKEPSNPPNVWPRDDEEHEPAPDLPGF